MTHFDIARRLAINFVGFGASVLLTSTAFRVLGVHWYTLAVAIVACVLAWTGLDYLADRPTWPPREQRSTIELSTFTRDGSRFLQVLPGNGHRYTMLLEGRALDEFQRVAASAGASVSPDVLAFAKIIEQGAGLQALYSLAREVDPKAVAENLEVIRGLVRRLAIEADAMAEAYEHGFVLEFLRRSDEASAAAHELGTAALVLHLKAVQARANLFLQNRDR